MNVKSLLNLLVIFVLSFYAAHTNANSLQIQKFIEQWQQQNQIPAVTLGIKKIGEKPDYYFTGSTLLKDGKKINENTLFAVGSITKTFIAAIILQLQENHKLSLDDTLGKYLTDYPRWQKVTLRQLLNMTSGIPNFTRTSEFKNLIADKPSLYHSPAFFVNLAYQQKDEFNPGKSWSYSNTNYYLLGMIIEKLTQQSLESEVQQRFIKPLKLKNTHYFSHSYPIIVSDHQAHAYLNNTDVTDENPAYYGPAGCMLMSIVDLINWTEALFSPGKILSLKSLNELQTTQIVPPNPPKPNNSRYGLGIYSLFIPDYGLVWWYTGVIDGYSSVLLWIPDKKIIIAAQINRWQNNNFGLLMPNQNFIHSILKFVNTNKHKTTQ